MIEEDFWKEIERARKILRLPKEITRNSLIARYKELAKEYHPDKGGDPEEFKKINWAYKILLNYCDNYIITLKPNLKIDIPEQVWFFKFGEDPVWGKSTFRKSKE